MNNLTLFLYLADVINSFAALFIITGLLTIGLIIVWYIHTAVNNDNAGYYTQYKVKPYPIKGATRMGLLAFFLFILAGLIPSKQTMYLMAGSEIGETVVTSPEAKEIYNDVRSVIRAQLEGLKTK